jgi:CheY-like chemotaxis protein
MKGRYCVGETVDDIKRDFGASVRIWRRRLGFSQDELAWRAGLHRTYVCDIERGTRNVSLESIEKLSRALEISTATLFSYWVYSSQGRPIELPDRSLVDVLYVENEVEVFEAAIESLRLAGVANRFRLARDGEEALAMLRAPELSKKALLGGKETQSERYRPQIILLDLGLPKRNSLEVLGHLKGDSETASIPVVVVTGPAGKTEWLRSEGLGATDYIVKPLSFRKLISVASHLSLQWGLLRA